MYVIICDATGVGGGCTLKREINDCKFLGIMESIKLPIFPWSVEEELWRGGGGTDAWEEKDIAY